MRVTARKRLQGFFQYWANLTQSGTDAPTANVLVNDIGTVTLARTGTGVYTLTATGRFPAGTIVSVTDNTTGLNKKKIVRTSNNVITITTSTAEIPDPPAAGALTLTDADEILSATPIRIMIPVI